MPRGRKRIMTDAQVSEAREMYESGMTLAQVAAEFGVTGPTIAKELRKAGVDIRAKGREKGDDLITFSESMLENIKSMYEDGYSIGEIAELFHVSYPVIRKTLSGLGVQVRGRGRTKGSKNKDKSEDILAVSTEDVLPKMAGDVSYLPLTDLNPMENPERFEKLYESFFADHAAEDTVVYIDTDKAAVVYTGLQNASKTAMKNWRADWRKSEERAKVA